MRQWARRGTRPRQPADQRYKSAYLFGAICPARGVGAGMALPFADTDAMQFHLDEISRHVARGAHAELLFEMFSQRYERGSTIVTSNLPFDEWTGVFASERLTGALLDRLTHHVHILEMNGDSYRLKQSKHRSRSMLDETRPGETSQA